MGNYRIKLAKIIIFLGQNLFFVRGKIRNLFWRLTLRIINYDKSKDPKTSRVKTNVNGVPLFFYFDYLSDVKIAFGNYNNQEIKFLKKKMKDGTTFIDIGSNIGFYTMNIANFFADKNLLKIISIEPNPIMVDRQKENIELLNDKFKGIREKIYLENFAVSNEEKNFYLDYEKGYGPAVLTSKITKKSIPVKSTTLIKIHKKHNIVKIDCLKIDVEGHEDQALIPFFKLSDTKIFPKHIVIEHTSNNKWKDKNLMNFLKEKGYKTILITRSNTCLSL